MDLFDEKNERKTLKYFRDTPRTKVITLYFWIRIWPMLVKSKEQMDRGSFRMLDRDISADTCSDILNKNLRLFCFINKNGSSAFIQNDLRFSQNAK